MWEEKLSTVVPVFIFYKNPKNLWPIFIGSLHKSKFRTRHVCYPFYETGLADFDRYWWFWSECIDQELATFRMQP